MIFLKRRDILHQPVDFRLVTGIKGSAAKYSNILKEKRDADKEKRRAGPAIDSIDNKGQSH